MYENFDIAPMVAAAKKDVRSVVTPFKLYNWTPRGNAPYYRNAKGSHDPIFTANAKNLGRLFWSQWGLPDAKGNMYGQGLYAALDPVATFSYSRGTSYPQTDEFQLIEMSIQKDFKFLQLSRDYFKTGSTSSNTSSSYYPSSSLSTWSSTPGAQAVLTQFGCTNSNANSQFQNGGVGYYSSSYSSSSGTVSPCNKLMKYIYKDLLKVDALAYDYNAQSFLTCSAGRSNYYSSSAPAFVIMNDAWMNDSNIAYYNRRTKDAVESRRTIQTLFMNEIEANKIVADLKTVARPAIIQILTQHPNYVIRNGGTSCSVYGCNMTIKGCAEEDETNCVGTAIRLPMPNADTLTQTMAASTGYGKLLWNDLEGLKKTPKADIDSWLISNRMGCDGTAPYVNAYATETK